MKKFHSTGPFSIGLDATELMCCPEGGRFVAIDAPGHGALAVVVVRLSDDTEDNPQLLGNARLFAAAPELLSALQDEHKALDWLMARLIELDPKFMPTKSPIWPALVAGNAAIGKVTGNAS